MNLKEILYLPQYKNGYLAVFIILFLCTSFIYGNSLFGQFVFDDRGIVINRPEISQLTNIPKLFFLPYTYLTPEAGSYRPLTMASFAFDYAFYKDNSLGYHLSNVFLHSVVSFLIFLLIFKLTRNLFLTWSTSLFFLTHPVHTEAVTSIVGRGELLWSLFALLTLILALEYSNRLLVFITFLLALFAKESAVSIPIVFFIIIWQQNKHFSKSIKKEADTIIAFLSGYLFYFLFRYLTLGKNIFSNNATIVENSLNFTDPMTRFLTALEIMILYFGKLIFPIKLSSDYSYNQIPYETDLSILTLLGFFILIFLILLCVIRVKRLKYISCASAFFLIPFLPISNFFLPSGTIMGERLLYLPSLGFCFFLGLIAYYFYNKSSLIKPFILITVVIIVVSYSLRTFLRNFDWQNEERLFTSAAKISPHSVLSRSNLGAIYFLKGDFINAEKEFIAANRIYDKYPQAVNNLGLIYLRQKKFLEAEEQFKKVITINPAYLLGYRNLSDLYLQIKSLDPAIKYAKMGLQITADDPQLNFYLGKAYFLKQDPTNALFYLQKTFNLGLINPELTKMLKGFKN